MFEYEYDLKAFEECAEKYGTFIARLNHSPYLSMMRWTSEFFVCVFNISIIYIINFLKTFSFQVF